jgi:hypothetical protein
MHTLTLRARLIAAGCAAAALWGIGAGAWAISQSLAPLIFFGYLGTIIAPGILFYLGLPPAKRSAGRRPLVAAIGIGMLAAALARVLAQHSIVAVEGFFFELFSGTVSQSRSSAWCSVVRSVSSSRTSCTLPPVAVAIYHPTAHGAAQSARHSSGVTCSWIIAHPTFCHCCALLSCT